MEDSTTVSFMIPADPEVSFLVSVEVQAARNASNIKISFFICVY
jgi:hypothetical protein